MSKFEGCEVSGFKEMLDATRRIQKRIREMNFARSIEPSFVRREKCTGLLNKQALENLCDYKKGPHLFRIRFKDEK